MYVYKISLFLLLYTHSSNNILKEKIDVGLVQDILAYPFLVLVNNCGRGGRGRIDEPHHYRPFDKPDKSYKECLSLVSSSILYTAPFPVTLSTIQCRYLNVPIPLRATLPLPLSIPTDAINYTRTPHSCNHGYPFPYPPVFFDVDFFERNFFLTSHLFSILLTLA